MSAADLYTWLEDIPSDNESIQSNCDTDDNESVDMEVDLPEDNIQLLNTTNEGLLNWDSEDELPLTAFLPVRTTAPNFTWTKSLNNIIEQAEFIETSGPNIRDHNNLEPLDIFLLLFPEELLQKIVFETNLYATQRDLGDKYVPTTISEIKCFLGLNILMGIKKLPSYKEIGRAHV